MSKRIQKALSNLNAYIDDDRQRLCDRVKKLEKSHNRLIRYLNESLALLDAIYLHCNDLSLNERLCNWYGELSLRLEEEIHRVVL